MGFDHGGREKRFSIELKGDKIFLIIYLYVPENGLRFEKKSSLQLPR